MDTPMIRELIRARQQELVELAAAFIRIPSENPSPELKKTSAEIGRIIHRYLEAKGLSVTEHRRIESGLVTVVGDVSFASSVGPRLLFSGHSDVVPAGDRSRWSFDPFSGEVRDGMLLGRGAADMKGGLAALVFVAGLLQEFGAELDLKGSLGVVVSPDEESGGMEVASLLEQGLIEGDACLIGEPTYPLHPVIGEKGWLLMRVTIEGEPGHGSLQPLSGVSAIRRGAVAVETLAGIWELRATPPVELLQLLYNTEWVMYQVLGRIDPLAQILYRPSYNPGIIEGGTAVNSIAERCVIEVDCRVPYGMDSGYVLDVARNLVRATAPSAVVEPMVPFSNPNWTSEDAPIVQATNFGIEQVHGREAPISNVLLLNSSDARHFRRHGIDTVLYGPGQYHTIHGYDEQVPVESLVKSAEVFAEVAIDYLTGVQ